MVHVSVPASLRRGPWPKNEERKKKKRKRRNRINNNFKKTKLFAKALLCCHGCGSVTSRQGNVRRRGSDGFWGLAPAKNTKTQKKTRRSRYHNNVMDNVSSPPLHTT